MIEKNDHTTALFLLGKGVRKQHIPGWAPDAQPVNPLQESSMFATRKMIAAARTLHSSNVDELMEAFADDHRAKSQPRERKNIVATSAAAAAREPQASASATQTSLPQKTAA